MIRSGNDIWHSRSDRSGSFISCAGQLAVPVTHLTSFFPRNVERWIVAFDPRLQSKTFSLLQTLLGSRVHGALPLGIVDPATVLKYGTLHASDPTVGLIDFVIWHRGRRLHGSTDYTQAFAPYGEWPASRVRLCCDVTDDNIAMLFNEPRKRLEERCHRLTRALVSESCIQYKPPAEMPQHCLFIECGECEWIAHCGGDDDYLLPTGEIACQPASIEGWLDVAGWIVGTIPFGVKYGRIAPGDTQLLFRAGRVVATSGMDRALRSDIELALERIPALQNVCEVGLGQSPGASMAAHTSEVGCLWHERNVGLHLGLGAELPELCDPAARATSHHLDIVVAHGALTTAAPSEREILSW